MSAYFLAVMGAIGTAAIIIACVCAFAALIILIICAGESDDEARGPFLTALTWLAFTAALSIVVATLVPSPRQLMEAHRAQEVLEGKAK